MPENIFKGWIIKVLVAFCGLSITMFGYFMQRMINTYDEGFGEINRKLEIHTQALFEVQKSVIGISSRQDLTNEKVTQLGVLESEHYTEVQKLQQKVYKYP